MLDLLHNIIFDYTLRNVALGAGVLGIISGTLGSYAVLRRQSLLGDTIPHAALPGIALAFLITGSKSTAILLLGAALAGWVATLIMLNIIRTTRIKEDTSLGLVLSVFFGFGLVLLTYIQKLPTATQAGLEKFLFGQAATLLAEDVTLMAILGLIALFLTALFWKEFKLLSFDADFGVTLNFPMQAVNLVLTTLLVIAIVIGLQTVGVVLMSAMVVAPAAAARQWTNRLGIMVLLSALFGAGAGIGGAVISSLVPKLPTGPTIVLCISGLVLLSIFLAPARGLLWNWARQYRNRRNFRAEAVLLDLYALAQQHQNRLHGHSAAVLKTMNLNRAAVNKCLEILQERGLAVSPVSGIWGLTEAGLRKAEQLAKTHGGKP